MSSPSHPRFSKNKYKPIVYKNVDEDSYSFKTFCKYIKRSSSWEPCIPFNLIHWNEYLDPPELDQDFHIGKQVDDSTRRSVLSVIKFN